ncbi:23S rRNA (pseudouridine(1915)-N(3))-methyltransferase RlmH [Acetobacteroides hydrogenigenes]|uniref:Ribosomal RNA large subunit methyltransferase H n=1 Tax=Acetobacteroides hydrogenigenes TaxID=979970 RepID=A0A4R2E440_9BACT|nr:23S rRNA (pseudouridine(1915)-N(3))-methyltransferase RlmH [Acetobacteroides hydrogenigenes]TCN62127.1 23S rRNA (pseudouridine1915-N3)-methyltransferase [Acetobacteroides hydrogenigenes]
MKIDLVLVGKSDQKYLQEGIDIYLKRLKHYCQFEMKVIPDLKSTKSLSEEQQKEKEGELIMNQIKDSDFVILLDERGESLSSVDFAQLIEKRQVAGTRKISFVIGGPYGFSKEAYAKANAKLSLSAMTFSHQMVRLLFIEQLYRAFTIINGEPYHHK